MQQQARTKSTQRKTRCKKHIFSHRALPSTGKSSLCFCYLIAIGGTKPATSPAEKPVSMPPIVTQRHCHDLSLMPSMRGDHETMTMVAVVVQQCSRGIRPPPRSLKSHRPTCASFSRLASLHCPAINDFEIYTGDIYLSISSIYFALLPRLRAYSCSVMPLRGLPSAPRPSPRRRMNPAR